MRNNTIKESRTANIGLAIWRLTCFVETFVQGSSVGILLNFCAKKPPHRQAVTRYRLWGRATFTTGKLTLNLDKLFI